MIRDEKSIKPFLRERYRARRNLFRAQLLLTHRCNLVCRHCNVCHEPRAELTTADWLRVVRELAELGCLHLLFSGGEATLRDDFFEIVGTAQQLGFGLSLYSNGVAWPAAFISRVRDWRWEKIAVSVYDIDPRRHDRITGVAGSWSAAIHALESLRAVGIPAVVNHLVMRGTRRGAARLRAWADAQGFSWRSDDVVLPDLHGGDAPVRVRAQAGQPPAAVIAPGHPLRRRDCGCGSVGVMINAYGDVLPCSFFPLPLGNVQYAALSAVWHHSPLLPVLHRGLARANELRPCGSCSARDDCLHCYGLALLEDGSLYRAPSTICRLPAAAAVPAVNG